MAEQINNNISSNEFDEFDFYENIELSSLKIKECKKLLSNKNIGFLKGFLKYHCFLNEYYKQQLDTITDGIDLRASINKSNERINLILEIMENK